MAHVEALTGMSPAKRTAFLALMAAASHGE